MHWSDWYKHLGRRDPSQVFSFQGTMPPPPGSATSAGGDPGTGAGASEGTKPRRACGLPLTLRVLCLGLLVTGNGIALTVYRIGGLPPDEASVDVVHLSWEESSIGYGGSLDLVDVTEEGNMAPVFLAPDRNIALDAAARGGGPFGAKFGSKTKNEILDRVADGDSTTALGSSDFIENRDWPVIGVELGGLMPINRVVFYPTTDHQDFYVEDYRLHVFRGDPSILVTPWARLGSLEEIARNEHNRSPRVEVTLPTRLLHTVVLVISDPAVIDVNRNPDYSVWLRPWEIAEMEVYGEGYAPNASYVSRILDLGAVSSMGSVRFRGSKARDARVQIRTRSGSDDDPVRYWRKTGRGNDLSFRDDQGRPLTRSDYESMPLGEQAGTTHDVDHWSFWSSPYAFGDSAGTSFASPGPNQFMQLQIEFESFGSAGSELSHLEIETSPPVAQRVVGEVSPGSAVAGEETEFVFAFRASFTPAESGDGGESGFDRFVLSTPGELTGVDSVRVNTRPIPCELVVDGSLVTCDQQEFPGAQVELALPRMDFRDSGKLVEVFFRARVFRFGTVFDGELSDSKRPGDVGQFVSGGDATFLLNSNSLSVGVDLSGALLQAVGVSNPVVTPNGDGVNDEVSFQYTLLQLASGQTVTVDVFDLSGRRVRRVYEGMDTSGRSERSWDGRGESGPLAPGIYLYTVRVNADSREAERSGVVSVVY